MAAVLVVVPLAAVLVRRRSAGIGLAIGWLAFLAVSWSEVLAAHNVAEVPIGVAFWVGTALALGTAAGLVWWVVVSSRPPPFGSPTRPRPDPDAEVWVR